MCCRIVCTVGWCVYFCFFFPADSLSSAPSFDDSDSDSDVNDFSDTGKFSLELMRVQLMLCSA